MTDAELAAIEKRAAAAWDGWVLHDERSPIIAVVRTDVPALVADVRRLREIGVAARAVIALDINSDYLAGERTCRHCDQWLNHGSHDDDCAVGKLAALLVEEGGNG